MEDFYTELERYAKEGQTPPEEIAGRVLEDSTDLERLVRIAAINRERFFGNGVRIHILNNVKNGNCSEDCGYCAQRKDGKDPSDGAAEEIPVYNWKQDDEIIEEARRAYESGAYRHCLVLSGRGPSESRVQEYAKTVRRLKTEFPGMEICLSAGILTSPDQAKILQEAGLDRYNHNLNTSMAHHDDITTTHRYQDRMDTIRAMREAGVELCSGVIAGMGEASADLVEVAYSLRKNRVASIPVNFFIPVPGHGLDSFEQFSPEKALRILILYRIVNPDAEIRMAAGRELYLSDLQPLALRVANSLFVSGYLNVHGSNLEQTIGMIQQAGCVVDWKGSERPEELQSILRGISAQPESMNGGSSPRGMKNLSDLRPFLKKLDH